MARQRFIHPDIWSDPSLGSLKPIERLMFIGLFSNADDEGRLPGNPAYLRSTIFPYDDFSNAQIKTMRDRISSVCPNVLVYEVAGIEYIALLQWQRYQSPRYAKPSKYPSPDRGKPVESSLKPCNQIDANMTQDCNQIDASLQPNSNNIATTDSNRDSISIMSLSSARAREKQPSEPQDPLDEPTPSAPSAELSEAFMALTGAPITPAVLEDIQVYKTDLGVDEDLILEVIRETKRKGKRTWDYARGIIRNALQEGISTGEAFRARAGPQSLAKPNRGKGNLTYRKGGNENGQAAASGAYTEPGIDWDAVFDKAARARDLAARDTR